MMKMWNASWFDFLRGDHDAVFFLSWSCAFVLLWVLLCPPLACSDAGSRSTASVDAADPMVAPQSWRERASKRKGNTVEAEPPEEKPKEPLYNKLSEKDREKLEQAGQKRGEKSEAQKVCHKQFGQISALRSRFLDSKSKSVSAVRETWLGPLKEAREDAGVLAAWAQRTSGAPADIKVYTETEEELREVIDALSAGKLEKARQVFKKVGKEVSTKVVVAAVGAGLTAAAGAAAGAF